MPARTGSSARLNHSTRWVTSGCTGSLLRYEADPARRRSVATYWGYEDELEARGDVTVVRDTPYVVEQHPVI